MVPKVIFIFVHAGVQGNEKVDKWIVLKQAVIEEGQPMDRADIVNNLKKIDKKEDFENRESTLMFRIKEMGSEIGTAKNETFTECERRLINQSGNY
jgi:RNA polymerase-interacting CarD/CdnL/TRCF family regulator